MWHGKENRKKEKEKENVKEHDPQVTPSRRAEGSDHNQGRALINP